MGSARWTVNDAVAIEEGLPDRGYVPQTADFTQGIIARPQRRVHQPALMNLAEELLDLKRDKDPQRRGKRFETFLARLLEQEGFEVSHNPKTARPRQTDLVAQHERTFFIVEAKWSQEKTDLDEIASVRDRLGRVPPDVFACVFSMAGFSKGAVEEVSGRRGQEIILFNGTEVHGIAEGRLSFMELLDHKRQRLRIDAIAHLTEERTTKPPRLHLRTGPDVFQVGSRRTTWMKAGSHENDILFSNEFLEFTGRHYRSVFSLELQPLNIREMGELEKTLGLLHQQLGLSGQGSFAIHQRNVGWFGFGSQTFLSAVKEQKARYDELKWNSYHHSEELAYFDRLDTGGLICLSSRQSVGQGNHFHSSMVEILFPGVPVDMSRVRQLCRLTGNQAGQLESVGRNPLQTIRFNPKIRVEPVSAIVSETDRGPWTSGLVVKNPFLKLALPASNDERRPVDELKRAIPSCEVLLCALRQWHSTETLMGQYELCLVEGLWIEHYYVMHAVCDWI